MAGRRDSFTVLWLGQKCRGLDNYPHCLSFFFGGVPYYNYSFIGPRTLF